MTETSIPSPENASPERVEQILGELAVADAAKFAAFFGRARRLFPREATRACLHHIAQHPSGPATDGILPWLCSSEKYLAVLLDPDFLTLEQAQNAAVLLRQFDPRFFANFAHLTVNSAFKEEADPASSRDLLSRALELLESVESYDVLFSWLRGLTAHADPHVRSKAAKTLCKLRPSIPNVLRQLGSKDARVRANAIEALWNVQDEETTSVFQSALQDPNHRVVVNALVGLYLREQMPEGPAFQTLVQLADHPADEFRAAAIWAFGFLSNHKAIPALQKLSNDESETIREKAALVLARLSASNSAA